MPTSRSRRTALPPRSKKIWNKSGLWFAPEAFTIAPAPCGHGSVFDGVANDRDRAMRLFGAVHGQSIDFFLCKLPHQLSRVRRQRHQGARRGTGQGQGGITVDQVLRVLGHSQGIQTRRHAIGGLVHFENYSAIKKASPAPDTRQPETSTHFG